jgi:hypothetical protein
VPLSQTEIDQEQGQIDRTKEQLGQIGLVRPTKEQLGQIELDLRTQEPLGQLRFEGQTQLPDPQSQNLKQNVPRQIPMPFGQHALNRQTQMPRGQVGIHC